MSHMNYFEPYESKPQGHEDHLTRAFLVLLRFSPIALLSFYDAIRVSCLDRADKLGIQVKLPSSSVLPVSDVDFETQTSTICDEQVGAVLSVLLTDEWIGEDITIKPSNRSAIYDGVINFGGELSIIIENKPNHGHVWREQLNPSVKSLPEDSILIEVPSVVEWKNIIRSLNQIRSMESVGGAEGLIIDDFLSLVSERFSNLNPFDHLSQCGNDDSLIRRRIRNLLSLVAGPKSLVRYHTGWGICMNFGLPEIWSIGVIDENISENSGHLTVSLYYGDTQSQSKAFYKRNLSYEHVKKSLVADWVIQPNFHIAFAQRVLLRLDCPESRIKEYYDFWRSNSASIRQHDRREVLELIRKLEAEGLVNITEKNESDIGSRIETSSYTKFNICPSIGIHYRIPIDVARKLDDKGELASELFKRMKEGLNLVLSDVSPILKAPEKSSRS